MSGTLKIGGKTLATHNSNTNIAKIQLGSADDVVITDSAGNSILTENGSVVALNNVDTATIGSNALVVDASGNVGIGASPDGILHISKEDGTIYDATATDGQVGVGPTIYLENPANANNTVGGQIVFGMRSTEGQCRIGATGGTAPTLVFGTADAERMQITSSGQVWLNDVYGDTVTGSPLYISSAGKLGLSASIRAAKTNISNLESVDWIYDLNPVSFQYRITDDDDNYTDIAENVIQYGLIAEEVEAINSDLAFYIESENVMELRGVKYDILIAPLLKAVQQQKALIESQQSQIDALTARIEALEATP